ncbi:MAG: hypothetical protein RJA70_3883 [Pseudomonadota bacterium]|jgi:proton-translocating NADH-quinone oxidoreductase chain M
MIDLLTCIPVFAPLLGAVLVALCPPDQTGARRLLALLGPVLVLATAVAAALSFDAGVGGYQFETRFDWIPDHGLALRFGIDSLSLPMLLLSGVGGVCALLATGPSEARSKEHDVLLLLALTAVNGAFLSIGFFFFYLFAELTTLPKYLLIARWARRGASEQAPRVALQTTLYVLAGAMMLLAVMGLLTANATGPLDFDTGQAALASLDPELGLILYGIAAVAFGLWSGLWPLHSWAPPVYTTALGPTNVVFGGIVKFFGLYGLLRLGSALLPAAAAELAPVLLVFGALNILYGALAAMRQSDWNRVIAFASISHAGYTLIAISIGSSLTLVSAATLMLAHGLVSALGFVLSDELEWSTGTRDISRLGGLATSVPLLSVGFVMLAIAGSGLPGSLAFAGELMMFFGTWAHGTPVAQTVTVIAVFGVILSATYLFSALHSTFYGPARGLAAIAKPRPLPIAAAALLVLVTLTLGVFPRFVTDPSVSTQSSSLAERTPLAAAEVVR